MKPNIIIVMTDQQQAKLRRGAGYALDTMPRLDAFAAEGVDIARAYTPNPSCAPARVSLFTGRYPSSHKVRTNHNIGDAAFSKDLLTVLKDAGYQTAICGKNHTYFDCAKDFDFHAESGHLGHEWGKDGLPVSPMQKEFQTFMEGTMFIGSPDPTPFPVECQLPWRNVSAALNFIDGRDPEKPFFAWVSFAEPHNPYQVPEPYFSMFPPEVLPELPTAKMDLTEKSERFAWTRNTMDEIFGEKPERVAWMRSAYHGMLRLIDDQFGRLLDGLDERGLKEDTVVVFLADHGDFAGEYSMMRKGPDLPDVLTRIPMVWRIPGNPARGRLEDGFASLIDILPTFCDLLEIPIPLGVQGKSLLPLLTGNTDDCAKEYSYALCESGYGGLYWNAEDGLDICEEGACRNNRRTFDCLNSWTQCGQMRSIQTGDFKLQTDMLGNSRLYNLKEDPDELYDLWGKAGYEAISAELAANLAATMMWADDPLPPPRHRYRIKRHPKGFRYAKLRMDDPGVEQDK